MVIFDLAEMGPRGLSDNEVIPAAVRVSASGGRLRPEELLCIEQALVEVILHLLSLSRNKK